MQEKYEEEFFELEDRGEEDEDDFFIHFNKAYSFEGQEYEGIDLSPVQEITGRQVELAEKRFAKQGAFSAIPEMTYGFAFMLAAMATKRPVEFFERLPANEATKVKNTLVGYLYS